MFFGGPPPPPPPLYDIFQQNLQNRHTVIFKEYFYSFRVFCIVQIRVKSSFGWVSIGGNTQITF